MLDNTDKQIIEELLQNGRITMKQLGERVHMTGQAVASRVAKLEEDGLIEGYTIRLNQAKAGYPVHTFINIFTKSSDHKPLLAFIEQQKVTKMNLFKISGEGCYLLESRFPSNHELDLFLSDLTRYANYRLTIVVSKK